MLKKTKLIIKATLVAGTLDILAGFISYFLQTGKNPLNILTYIASGLFGDIANESGDLMFVIGLLLHFLIAFIFALLFSKIYNYLRIWFGNDFIIAIAFGISVWLMMNLIVLPISATAPIPFSWTGALLNCAILIICIGMPLSFLFSKNQGKL